MLNLVYTKPEQNFQSWLSVWASGHTVKTYVFSVKIFSEWFFSIHKKTAEPTDVTESDLKQFQEFLTSKNYKPSSVNVHLKAVKAWFRWAMLTGKIQKMPTLPKPVTIENFPKALSQTEQDRLMKEVERRCKTRDAAIVGMLLFCGLRLSEVVRLKMSDLSINGHHSTVKIRDVAGGHREVPMPERTKKDVLAWIEQKNKKFPSSEYLFVNRTGDPLSTRYVEKIIENCGRFAGLNVRPRALRHTAVANMLKDGVDPVVIANMMGFAYISSVCARAASNG